MWDITIKLVTVCQSLIENKVTTVTLGMHAWRVGQYKMVSALSSLLFGLLTPNVSNPRDLFSSICSRTEDLGIYGADCHWIDALSVTSEEC